jgi:hypothetical protein
MRTIALLAFTLITLAAHTQNTINSYKYVLVPERFDFLKSDDLYYLNSTSKSLLEKKGFTVYMRNGNMPPALAANKCAALVVEVTQRKALFTTNLTVELKDCTGNILFKSKEGKSREKEYYAAYDEALKDAFTSLNAVTYNYDSTLTPPIQAPAAQMQQATQTQQPTQAAQTQAVQPQTQQPAQTQQTAQTQSTQPQTQSAPAQTLYAQPIPNGYQLIDMTPKKVLKLLKTPTPDYYIAESDTAGGIVFKKVGEWIHEYYKDEKLISQKLQIKF